MLKYSHDPVERAHITACALGINLNIDFQSYGGEKSIRAMVGDEIVFHGTSGQTVTFLCGLHSEVSSLLALFSSEGVHHQDESSCHELISGTVSPKRLMAVYAKWIKGNEILIRHLGY